MRGVSVLRVMYLMFLCWCPGASAAPTGIAMFAPEGVVREVRQATARFSAPMVAFGDLRAPAPFEVDCPVPGTGRWVDDRTWAYDFERELPGAVRCRFTLRPDARDLQGQALAGRREFVVATGGAAPVWRDVIDYLHRDRPSRAPSAPSGLVRQTVAFTPAVEPPHSEWFVRGTETASVELLAPGQRQPKIVYPADSSLIALDPDIPEKLQRVRFQAHGAQGLAWMLDGAELEQSALDAGWAPAPGKHELKLVGKDGRTLARARFEVRGGAQLVSSFSTSSGGSSASSTSGKGEAIGKYSGESER